MSERTIAISNKAIHDEINEYGQLSLYTCLWNDGSEIPLDWHNDDADFMELKLEFSFKHIINEMIEFNRLESMTGKKLTGIWFDNEDKKKVDLYKQELEKCIERLNQIQFMDILKEDN